MLVNRHRTTGQRAAETRLLDLPHTLADGHDVIFGHDPFRLHREYPVQIRSTGTPEGGGFLFRRDHELAVESVDILLPQKSVGLSQGMDSRQPKFLWQTSLPGAEV